jgi:gentisate 1,2-dioxygenase
MTEVAAEDFVKAASMQELYDLLDKCGIENGWNKKEPSLWPLPRRDFIGAHWPYTRAKAALDAAGRFVNTDLAERRNLILKNPIPDNSYPTVKTLVAAYQMVKSGEVAKSHRHSANALRLVLDTKEHAYTIVDGKKVPMEPGDVLLTPNWAWHGHSNEGPADAYWMDFLDVPLVHLLGPMFFEPHPDEYEKADGVAADSPFRFPWAQTKARLAEASDVSPGYREIELGAPAMATIDLHVARLDKGTSLKVEPNTRSEVVAIMNGKGVAKIDDLTFDFARGDALAAPAGCTQTWTASEETYLLRVSDAPVLDKLNWLRPIPAPKA